MRRPAHFWVRHFAAAVALVVTAALSVACSSSTPHRTGSTSPGTSVVASTTATTTTPTPTATQMAGNVPRQSYIALCTGTELLFVDPETGATLGQRPLTPIQKAPGGNAMDGSTGTFTPTGYVEVSAAGPSSCADLSWNDDLTAVAGLDRYPSGDTIPASMDVTLGEVTDAIDPPDHTSFDATSNVYYIDAEFNPFTGALWSIRNVDAGCAGEELHGPSYARVVSHDTVCDRDVEPPLIVFDGLTAKLPEIATHGTKYHDYDLDGSTVPASNYGVGVIRRSDSGRMGAFVAFNTNDRSQPPMLYTVPVSGGEPTKIAVLSDFDTGSAPEVVRFHDG